MARNKKIYTEEQLQQRIKDEVEKIYQRQEDERRFHYVHERIDRIYGRLDSLEARLNTREYKIEETTQPCNCCKD